MPGISVSASAVYKSYHLASKEVTVLRGIDLTVQAGERLAIVGPSGSGKSMLLHLLGTLDTPDKGDILLAGRSVLSLESAELADLRNQQIGFVFQFHHLLPEFSALENVMMPALIQRQAKNKARARALFLLESVGLTHRLTHKPGELSGGEQQRVALARSLALEPGLLLADEVTGNLDRDTGAEIHELLVRINEEQRVTLVVVTHNQDLAAMMGRVERLSGGLLQPRAQAA